MRKESLIIKIFVKFKKLKKKKKCARNTQTYNADKRTEFRHTRPTHSRVFRQTKTDKGRADRQRRRSRQTRTDKQTEMK